jgi:hypothetical protein
VLQLDLPEHIRVAAAVVRVRADVCNRRPPFAVTDRIADLVAVDDALQPVADREGGRLLPGPDRKLTQEL